MLRAVVRNDPGPLARVGFLVLLVLGLFSLGWITTTSTRGAYLGGDFRSLYASGRLMLSGRARGMYDLGTQGEMQRLFFSTDGSAAASDPYPMVYLSGYVLLFAPFAALPPGPSYYAWAIFSVVAFAAGLLWLARSLGLATWPLLLLGAGFYPFSQGLIEGQTHSLLFLFFVGFYLSLLKGNDRAAGVWLSLLTLKPQFVVLPVVLLLWKQRWDILRPFLTSAFVLVGISIALVGVDGTVEYVRLIRDSAALRGVPTNSPQGMINWRALAINAFDEAGPSLDLGVVVMGSLVTIAVALLPWRGRSWTRVAPHDLALLMLGLVAASLLVAFHSHKHALVLMLVPSLAALASISRFTPPLNLAIVVDVVALGPSIAALVWSVILARWGMPPTFTNMAMFAILVVALAFVGWRFLSIEPAPVLSSGAAAEGR